MNNRLYLHLYLHFKNPPHYLIHLWRNQVTDLLQSKCAKTPEEERNVR